MPELPRDIAGLSDEAAIRALEAATLKYLELSGVAISQIAAITKTLFEVEAPQGMAALEQSSLSEKGALCKQALAAMMESDDRRAARLAEQVVRDSIATGQLEPITLIIGGTFILSLAVISKVTYSSSKGWEVRPGFPGLAPVLEKAAKLISAAMGAGDEGVNRP